MCQPVSVRCSHWKSSPYAILKYLPAVGQLALGLPLEATLKESNADDSPFDLGIPSSTPPPSHISKLSNWWLLE